MNIAIIGAGHIGSTVARLLIEGGHAVMLSATSRESADRAAAEITGAHSGSIEEAIAFGEAIVVSVPLKAWPELARTQGHQLVGRVVIDTSNIAPERDGAVAEEAKRQGKGSGRFVLSLLPDGVKLAKAFNTLWYVTLGEEARRDGERIAMPIAADDPDALRITAEIVRDAGYLPITVGDLDSVRQFDAGMPAYNKALHEQALRQALAEPVG